MPLKLNCSAKLTMNFLMRILGSYFMYRSYKCYNPYFLDCMVRINATTQNFLNFLIFHVIKKYNLRSYGTYIGKIREISQTVRIIGPVHIIGPVRIIGT